MQFNLVSSNTDREINASFLLDINKKLGNNFAIHVNFGVNHQEFCFTQFQTGIYLPGPMLRPFFSQQLKLSSTLLRLPSVAG